MTSVPVVSLRDQLSIFENLKTPLGWSVRFRASPQKWDQTDGDIVVQAMNDAKRNPQELPFISDYSNEAVLVAIELAMIRLLNVVEFHHETISFRYTS